jgi:hypothetical protein
MASHDGDGSDTPAIGKIIKGESGTMEERAALRPRAVASSSSSSSNGRHSRHSSNHDGASISVGNGISPPSGPSPPNPDVMIPEVVPLPVREFYLLFLAIAIQEALMTADTYVCSSVSRCHVLSQCVV